MPDHVQIYATLSDATGRERVDAVLRDALRSHPDVTAVPDTPSTSTHLSGEELLVGYLVGVAGSLTVAALQAYLKAKLEEAFGEPDDGSSDEPASGEGPTQPSIQIVTTISVTMIGSLSPPDADADEP
jgi:hypothetical protein